MSNPHRQWLPWLNRVMVTLFLVFAYLQYNDPDPAVWIVVYVAAAGLSLRAPRAPRAREASRWFALGAGIWSVMLLGSGVAAGGLPAVLAGEGMASPGVEELREAGGLLIVAVWLACLTRLVPADSTQGAESP